MCFLHIIMLLLTIATVVLCYCCRVALNSMLQQLQRAQLLLANADLSLQQNEANWLLKVAWNMALQCNNHHKEMAEFFLICYQLSSYLPSDLSVLRRQKSCQLMSAAASVQVARATDIQADKVLISRV